MAISIISIAVALFGSLAIFYTRSTTPQRHLQRTVGRTKVPSIQLPDRVAQFGPMHLTECLDTMPEYYAPCFAKRHQNAVVAEEIVYPPFQMTSPIFAPSRPDDRQKWWDITWIIWDRAYKLGDRLRYNEKHGQLFVSVSTPLAFPGIFRMKG